jgi:hypothetical protein
MPAGGAATFGEQDKGKAGLEGSDAAVEAGDEGAGALCIDGNLAGAVEIPAYEGDLPERLLSQNAELERQAREEDRGVHVAEVVGGVDGGFVLVELFDADDADRGEADKE